MAINPTGLSWLDQWILSQGGELRGETADTPASTSSSTPSQYYPKRWVDRYLTEENWDYNDDNAISGPSPSISVGESFGSLFDSAKSIFDNFEVGDVFDVGEGAKGLFSGGLGGLVDGIKSDFSNFWAEEFDPLNNPSFTNQGPWGNAIRAWQDPSVSWQRALGATAIPIGAMAIPGAGLFGAVASALNAMGAYHDFTDADSNISFNVATDKFEWDSTDPGGGGIQWGRQNAFNTALNEARENPEMTVDVTAPYYDEASDEWDTRTFETPIGALATYLDPSTPDMAFATTGSPGAWFDQNSVSTFGNQMSMSFPGMTNSEALGSLSSREGNAFNSVMADAYAKGLGYNEAMAAVERAEAQAYHDSVTSDGTWTGGADGSGMSGSMSTDDGESYDWGDWY